MDVNPSSTPPEARRQTGLLMERQAEAYLVEQGLIPCDRNQHSRMGEIDLIMWDQATLVFIEVRYRRHNDQVSAAESITPAKQRRIIRTASRYLQQQFGNTPPDCRFDVILATGTPPRLEWLKAAFM